MIFYYINYLVLQKVLLLRNKNIKCKVYNVYILDVLYDFIKFIHAVHGQYVKDMQNVFYTYFVSFYIFTDTVDTCRNKYKAGHKRVIKKIARLAVLFDRFVNVLMLLSDKMLIIPHVIHFTMVQ